MSEYPEITIVTLFGGRFNLLEPYLFSLDRLDYPKDKLSLIWLTNYANETFQKILQFEADARQTTYQSLRLIVDTTVPSSPLVVEEGKGSEEHAAIIASLYNRVFSLVTTPYFFSLEDDMTVPEYTVKKLLSHNVPYACGAVFDRHQYGLFAWNLRRVRRVVSTPERKMMSTEDYVGVPIEKTWGAVPVGASTLACSLINTEIVRSISPKPFKSKHPMSIGLVGCDIVLCLDLEIRGHKRILDFDVRTLHYDSKCRPH